MSDSQTDSAKANSRRGASRPLRKNSKRGTRPIGGPKWAAVSRVFPFFMSAMFFLSALFSFFAPLPLLVLNLANGRVWAWAALATNGLLVFALGGPLSLGLYVVWVGVLVGLMPEFMRRGLKLEWTVAGVLGAMALLGSGLAYVGAAWKAGGGPSLAGLMHPSVAISEMKAQLTFWVDQMAQVIAQTSRGGGLTSDLETQRAIQEWKESLVAEFPSGVAVFSLILVWINLTMVLRLNPVNVRSRMGIPVGGLRLWKAPEWLVWPALVFGAAALFAPVGISIAAMNVLRFIGAIYVLQGAAVLAFAMEHFKVRGLMRSVVYISSFLFAIPLVLGFGFFDLWFDFRARFRQR